MRTRTLLLLALAATFVALGVAAVTFGAVGRGGASSLRVGVVVDCFGFFRGFQDLELAGAELPFIDRGAKLRKPDLAGGVSDARLSNGRRARLLIGCDEGGGYTTLIAAARRLVEQEHADVVIGGTWPGDGIVLGQVARRYPNVAFVAASAGPQEVTLLRRSENLFRIRPSYVQQAAGLGLYAYRNLGWRSVVMLAEDDEEGWNESAAFTAEFCAAGGHVDRRLGFPLAVTPEIARLARQADGVAVFSAGVTDPAVLLPAVRESFGARRLVVGLGIASDPRAAQLLRGVVSPERVPPPASHRRSLVARLRVAFPGVTPDAGRSGFTVDFETTVEAVLQAAERGSDLRRSLSQLELRLSAGSLRVDDNGQAVVPVALVRHTAAGQKTLARLPAVPPLLGGLLSRSTRLGRIAQPCRRAPAPAYARSIVSRPRPSR